MTYLWIDTSNFTTFVILLFTHSIINSPTILYTSCANTKVSSRNGAICKPCYLISIPRITAKLFNDIFRIRQKWFPFLFSILTKKGHNVNDILHNTLNSCHAIDITYYKWDWFSNYNVSWHDWYCLFIVILCLLFISIQGSYISL